MESSLESLAGRKDDGLGQGFLKRKRVVLKRGTVAFTSKYHVPHATSSLAAEIISIHLVLGPRKV